jgi:ATP-dependent protease ClpP protease subunit
MPKEVLIYGAINESSVSLLHQNLQLMQDTDEITVRVNSTGGSPEYGWGAISIIKDLKQAKKIKVDGQAHSMAAFLLCYVDDVDAVDVTEFLIHRAAYPSWLENSDMFDQPTKDNLSRVNASIEKAFRVKVDIAAFEALPDMVKNNWKTKDIFSLDDRREVYLTAKQAKQIGLIASITKITPAIAAEIKTIAKAAQSDNKIFIPSIEEGHKPIKPKTMTIDQLKAEHKDVFNQIVKDALATERDRIGAWMTFIDVDAAAVQKGITDGETISQTAMADFTRKAMAKASVSKLATESPETVTTEETAEEKATREKREGEAAKTEATLKSIKEAAKKLIS